MENIPNLEPRKDDSPEAIFEAGRKFGVYQFRESIICYIDVKFKNLKMGVNLT